MQNVHDAAVISPLQYEEVDIGKTTPARCLRQGLWLPLSDKMPFAVLMSSAQSYGRTSGGHLEIAVPPGEVGATLSRRLFGELDAMVKKTASYRGKVISLEQPDRYTGQTGALRVHKLRQVPARK
jgi:hypothetical protein